MTTFLDKHDLPCSKVETVTSSNRSPYTYQHRNEKMEETKHFIREQMQLGDVRSYPALFSGRKGQVIFTRTNKDIQELHDLAGRYSKFVERYALRECTSQRVASIREFPCFARVRLDSS